MMDYSILHNRVGVYGKVSEYIGSGADGKQHTRMQNYVNVMLRFPKPVAQGWQEARFWKLYFPLRICRFHTGT